MPDFSSHGFCGNFINYAAVNRITTFAFTDAWWTSRQYWKTIFLTRIVKGYRSRALVRCDAKRSEGWRSILYLSYPALPASVVERHHGRIRQGCLAQDGLVRMHAADILRWSAARALEGTAKGS